ncbi:flagellar hook protein FlgE [Roseomonas sp. OT10]|uniref:flagellar hook protein FlgE n=1 Tax=Roseomonas cutis TaxID=2897332 RepID=UPI001E3F0E85|nr:flagellar hook protein FlgE [Roseomonas sp. OT10]UFN48292.1 flagellar hook protein FlgE [Roseomonas sp. OT10]
MSLYGSLSTAISGLNAQSRALGNVADNVANSQTVGYKRVDTSFTSYITSSSRSSHLPGSVVARPDYANSAQGTVQTSDNPLSMAIAGQGFFPVSQSTGTTADGLPSFDERAFFTRAGDFSMDRDGFLVNSQGYFLEGWTMNAAGVPDRTRVAPLRIDQSVFNPVPTSSIDLAANLPADAAVGNSVTSQIQVYDGLGKVHTVQMSYTRTAENVWRLDMSAPDNQPAAALGSVELRFGVAATPAAANGTLGQIVDLDPTDGLTGAAAVAGDPAELSFGANFGQGGQPITLNLGTFGRAAGLTQFSGDQYEVRSLGQNGVPLGSFSSVSVQDNGDVSVNYDNGQSRIVARVPVATFSDPDKLQRVDGQAFLRTVESGEARISDVNSSGAGKLVSSAVESSNVDVASEFSKLILAQRAYTANTRIVTTTDEMLQDVLNMRR